MDYEFWYECWVNSEIGFYEGMVNQYLYDYWFELVGKVISVVFVFLCGKVYDMWWLYDWGYLVIGVEFSDVVCKDFFEEGGEKVKVYLGELFIIFKYDSLEFWCGDFF